MTRVPARKLFLDQDLSHISRLWQTLQWQPPQATHRLLPARRRSPVACGIVLLQAPPQPTLFPRAPTRQRRFMTRFSPSTHRVVAAGVLTRPSPVTTTRADSGQQLLRLLLLERRTTSLPGKPARLL